MMIAIVSLFALATQQTFSYVKPVCFVNIYFFYFKFFLNTHVFSFKVITKQSFSTIALRDATNSFDNFDKELPVLSK
jgi:hypothetical protein